MKIPVWEIFICNLISLIRSENAAAEDLMMEDYEITRFDDKNITVSHDNKDNRI